MARLRTYNKRAKNREWKAFLRWLIPQAKEKGIVVIPYDEYQKISRNK